MISLFDKDDFVSTGIALADTYNLINAFKMHVVMKNWKLYLVRPEVT